MNSANKVATERNWQALIELCSQHYKKFNAWPSVEGNILHFAKTFSIEKVELQPADFEEFKKRLPSMFP